VARETLPGQAGDDFMLGPGIAIKGITGITNIAGITAPAPTPPVK
jgi:hypothetical protein